MHFLCRIKLIITLQYVLLLTAIFYLTLINFKEAELIIGLGNTQKVSFRILPTRDWLLYINLLVYLVNHFGLVSFYNKQICILLDLPSQVGSRFLNGLPQFFKRFQRLKSFNSSFKRSQSRRILFFVWSGDRYIGWHTLKLTWEHD